MKSARIEFCVECFDQRSRVVDLDTNIFATFLPAKCAHAALCTIEMRKPFDTQTVQQAAEQNGLPSRK